MTAMEKAFWWQAGVALLALIVVACLLPYWGEAALGGFGLLGIAAAAAWFLRRRGDQVVVDERDRTIDQDARRWAIYAAWAFLFTSVGVSTLLTTAEMIPKIQLTWILWLDFALCLLVKGAVGIVLYRRGDRAA